MVKNFFSSFKDNTATYKQFLSMLSKSVNATELNKLKFKVDKVNREFLDRTCPPVFSYEIEKFEKVQKIKKVHITEEKVEGLNNTVSFLETDVLLVYLNKNSNNSVTLKKEKFCNIDIICEEKVNETLSNTEGVPDFILLNCTDNSYLFQKFTEQQCDWLLENINVNYFFLRNYYLII